MTDTKYSNLRADFEAAIARTERIRKKLKRVTEERDAALKDLSDAFEQRDEAKRCSIAYRKDLHRVGADRDSWKTSAINAKKDNDRLKALVRRAICANCGKQIEAGEMRWVALDGRKYCKRCREDGEMSPE